MRKLILILSIVIMSAARDTPYVLKEELGVVKEVRNNSVRIGTDNEEEELAYLLKECSLKEGVEVAYVELFGRNIILYTFKDI